MTAELLDDQERVIRQSRGDLEKRAKGSGDPSTTGCVTGLMEQQKMMAWMLRVILPGRN